MVSTNKLEKIISSLGNDPPPGQQVTKTISIRISVMDLAKIDALAGMKDVSRNILLNEIIDAALSELLDKLKAKNPELAATLDTKAQELSKVILAEHEPSLPPKHKHRKPHEAE